MPAYTAQKHTIANVCSVRIFVLCVGVALFHWFSSFYLFPSPYISLLFFSIWTLNGVSRCVFWNFSFTSSLPHRVYVCGCCYFLRWPNKERNWNIHKQHQYYQRVSSNISIEFISSQRHDHIRRVKSIPPTISSPFNKQHTFKMLSLQKLAACFITEAY